MMITLVHGVFSINKHAGCVNNRQSLQRWPQSVPCQCSVCSLHASEWTAHRHN